MEISPLVLIGICLAVMFFGYFFGLFEGRGQGYKRRKDEEKFDVSARAPLETSTPSAGLEARSSKSDQQAKNLLGLRFDEKGRPQLELDGTSVEPSRLTADQRKRLIDLLVLTRPWVEGTAPKAPAATAPPASQFPAPSTADRLRPASSPERTPATASGATAGTSTPGPITQPLSMVAQIDAILQTRLVGTPLAQLGVRLAESLHGGAIVFVGKDQYGGVGEVPNPEIQAAIRGAIAEWEERYTPG